jgi:hypothetical protein
MVSLDELRVTIGYVSSHMRHAGIWRDSQKSAHGFARLLGTAEQRKTSRDDSVSDCIPGHLLQCLSPKFQCLVIVASHHVGETQGGKSTGDVGVNPALDRPAVNRYAATTPQLLKWFHILNEKLAYADQVRPFNFLSAFQASRFSGNQDDAVGLGAEIQTKGRPRRHCVPKPIAPYDVDSARAAQKCFDRETGKPVPPSQLKTYRQALAQYHLSPEPKFLGAEHLDRGPTRRRHVEATAIDHIGKEANRWEQQFFLGLDLFLQIQYGTDTVDAATVREQLFACRNSISLRQLAEWTGISRNHISAFRRGKKDLSSDQLRRLALTIPSVCRSG